MALAAAATWRMRSWPRWFAIALPVVVCGMLLVPATLLQVGLRDATEPWYFTNDSTYQIEIAGDLVRHGHTPYGHDYGSSGLERFYPAANDQEAAFDRAAETPLRLLPRHGADRGRVARAPAALGRLPDLRAPRDARAPTRGARVPRRPLRAPGGRLGPGREPDPAQGRLVRDRGRARDPRARPRLRAPRARAARLGGSEPRRRAGAQAVRPRRGPVLRRHAADEARVARRPSTGPAPRSAASSSRR